MSTRAGTSAVGASGILAAGLASAAAALFTSCFGVAGTIVGAALTTMIITGGSSVLRFYLQTTAERARSVPDKLRARSFRRPGGPVASSVSDSSTTTRFRRYSPARRRAVVVGALLDALASFVIAATTVTALEIGAGESLSCWVW